MATAASRQRSSTLSTRDLINVGVFTAVYFVIMFAAGVVGFIGPVLMFVGYLVSIAANGVVIALFLARVRKFGALSLLGLLVCGVMAAMGEPIYVLLGIVLAVIGDLIARTGAYRSVFRNSLGYAVQSLWYSTPLLPIVFDSVGFRTYVTDRLNAEYADKLLDLVTIPTLAGWTLVVFVVALASGFLGHRVLQRHFQRAGLAS